ncbi:MAG: pyruvate kinase [Candidatus Kerfeldbacteria bacterium]
MKHTKIVCTIGPSSRTATRLEEMISAGMNVARLNFSHGDYEDHAKLVKTIRAVSRRKKTPIAILQDLQGPRIRTGDLPKEGITIKKGDSVVLVSQKEYEKENSKGHVYLPIQYTRLYQYVKPKGTIFIQDGTINLRVIRVKDKKIHTEVVQGGTVFSHKGINAPGVTIGGAVITPKDKEDLKFGIKQDVDYVALSFVKDAQNIRNLRKMIPKSKRIKIIAKIERAEAIANFDKILEVVDGIMVARGDLGVELGPSEIPLIQKEIILKCLKAAKPVIVATQMLESMVSNPSPTRAEANDVANAIVDHTDAIMLSAESATGKFPVEAIRTMTNIADKVEKSRFDDLPAEIYGTRAETKSAGVAQSAVHLAEAIGARAIVVLSRSGQTATMVSKLRPQHATIVVFTDDEKVLRQLALVWGVVGIPVKLPRTREEFIRTTRKVIHDQRMARKGDFVVVVSGFIKSDLAIAEAVEI